MKTCTRLSVSLSLSLAFALGCVDRVDLEDRPCPCVDGFHCVGARCVAPSDAAAIQPPTAVWELPIDDLAAPGWRESSEIFDPPVLHTLDVLDVWSNEDKVAVLYGGWNANFAGEISLDSANDAGSLDEFGSRLLLVNDGNGWESQSAAEPGSLLDRGPYSSLEGDLYGSPNGRMFVSWSFPDQPVEVVDGQLHELGLAYPSELFVVDDQLAYAIVDEKVFRFDGDTWGPLPVALPQAIERLWASREMIFGVGDAGTVLSLAADHEAWRVHDTRTTDSFRHVWGFAPTDVWVSTWDGDLYHFDGTSWSKREWTTDPPVAPWEGLIEGLWGSEGTLYLHTNRRLVRYQAGQFDVVGHWPCTPRKLTEQEIREALALAVLPGMPPEQQVTARRELELQETCEGGLLVRSIWGNAADELFVLVSSGPNAAEAYQRAALLRFDGSSLHQM